MTPKEDKDAALRRLAERAGDDRKSADELRAEVSRLRAELLFRDPNDVVLDWNRPEHRLGYLSDAMHRLAQRAAILSAAVRADEGDVPFVIIHELADEIHMAAMLLDNRVEAWREEQLAAEAEKRLQ